MLQVTIYIKSPNKAAKIDVNSHAIISENIPMIKINENLSIWIISKVSVLNYIFWNKFFGEVFQLKKTT